MGGDGRRWEEMGGDGRRWEEMEGCTARESGGKKRGNKPVVTIQVRIAKENEASIIRVVVVPLQTRPRQRGETCGEPAKQKEMKFWVELEEL